MIYIKDKYPKEQFERAFMDYWITMWQGKEGWDLSKPEVLAKCLARHFSSDEVKTILEKGNSPEYKKKLTENTQKALESGAFGAPWFIVENSKGVKEPFFGSDR